MPESCPQINNATFDACESSSPSLQRRTLSSEASLGSPRSCTLKLRPAIMISPTRPATSNSSLDTSLKKMKVPERSSTSSSVCLPAASNFFCSAPVSIISVKSSRPIKSSDDNGIALASLSRARICKNSHFMYNLARVRSSSVPTRCTHLPNTSIAHPDAFSMTFRSRSLDWHAANSSPLNNMTSSKTPSSSFNCGSSAP
mmetsp:Transcript_77728/g.121330  ORF Transcript_77728/g.121330 Transcript_77728/m.121330 type:complete len:200 (-) Transcript_77728:114-713(-)